MTTSIYQSLVNDIVGELKISPVSSFFSSPSRQHSVCHDDANEFGFDPVVVPSYEKTTVTGLSSAPPIMFDESPESSEFLLRRCCQSDEASHRSSEPPVRKPRKVRKRSPISIGHPIHDQKRRDALEKNRVAAAKCRQLKKEKTEQLRRNSQKIASDNSQLMNQVTLMKEQIHQMIMLLLQHAACQDCLSTEDLQQHLNNFMMDSYTNRSSPMRSDKFLEPHIDDPGTWENGSSPAQCLQISRFFPPLPELGGVFNYSLEFDSH